MAGHALRRAGPDGRQRRACSSTPPTCPRPRCTSQELFSRAGFPDGAFQTLLIGSAQGRGASSATDRVVAVTLTGSGPAGSSVASIAGDEVKKSVLELGGSDPFVVMPVGRPGPGGRGGAPPPAPSTTGSRASRPSGSSSTPTWPTSSSASSSSQMALAGGRRPDGREDRHRPAGHRAAAGRHGRAGRRRRGQGGDRPVRGQGPRRPRVVLPADGADRDHPGHAGPSRGGVRARGHPLPGGRASTRPSSWPTPPSSGSGPTPGPTTPASRIA